MHGSCPDTVQPGISPAELKWIIEAKKKKKKKGLMK